MISPGPNTRHKRGLLGPTTTLRAAPASTDEALGSERSVGPSAGDIDLRALSRVPPRLIRAG